MNCLKLVLFSLMVSPIIIAEEIEQTPMQMAQEPQESIKKESCETRDASKKMPCHYCDLAISAYKIKSREIPGKPSELNEELLQQYSPQALHEVLTLNAVYAEKMHEVIVQSAPQIYAAGMMLNSRQSQNQVIGNVFSMMVDAVIWQKIAEEFRAKAAELKNS